MRTLKILPLLSIALNALLPSAHGFITGWSTPHHAIPNIRSKTPPPLSCTPPLDELIVRDTTEGTGDVAATGNIVTVKYVGSLLGSGAQFDESMISFKLGTGRVLAGCDEGITGMRVGGTRVLKIPSALGFGPSGFGPEPYSVPSDADLEYRVELLSVASGPMAEAAAKMGIGLNPNTVYLK